MGILFPAVSLVLGTQQMLRKSLLNEWEFARWKKRESILYIYGALTVCQVLSLEPGWGRNFLAQSRCSVDAHGVCCPKTLGRFKAGRGGSHTGERWAGLLGEEDAVVGPEGSA